MGFSSISAVITLYVMPISFDISSMICNPMSRRPYLRCCTLRDCWDWRLHALTRRLKMELDPSITGGMSRSSAVMVAAGRSVESVGSPRMHLAGFNRHQSKSAATVRR